MALSDAPAGLDPDRDFERLRSPARRRFLARARRAGQDGRVDLDQAADDAYQEAWLELQRRPAQTVIEHDPAGYLAGIMWHRFHRLELRPARVETAPLDDDDAAAGGAEPDAVVEERQTLAAVRDALAALPERERTAVLLRAEGFGHDDVAATLGVSRRIARKLAERGRAQLSRELEAQERCASIASTLRAIGLGWPVRGDRRARLEEHVADCVSCRATIVALRREGALATTPTVVAGGGALTRVREVFEGLLWRGGGEAAAAAAGTKLVAGCIAAGVCVVGAVQFVPREAARTDPAPRPTAVARAAATPTAQAVRAATPVPSEPHGAQALRAHQQDVAEQRVRAARKRALTAERKARAAARWARAAARQAQAGAEQARAAAEQARVGAEQARVAGERAADAGRTAARQGTEAANRARDAADQVRDALAPLGGG